MTIRVDIHPDVRLKYVVTVRDSSGITDDILLSSTSQGYDGVDNPADMVRRLFAYPGPMLSVDAIAAMRDDGAVMPEPVELFITYTNGRVVGPERLR